MYWIPYSIAYILSWYDSRYSVCANPLDRPLWYTPRTQSWFLIGRLAFTYGSIAGLWLRYGLLIAAIAWFVYFSWDRFTSRLCYRVEFQKRAWKFYEMMKQDKENAGVPEEELIQRARELSKDLILRARRGEQT